MNAPFDLESALAAARTEWDARAAALRAAHRTGRPRPVFAACAERVPMLDGNAIDLAGQRWVVQSGSPAGVSVGPDLSVGFAAKAGERASFDPPRKIRAELCGERRYARGEPVTLQGVFNVDPASRIAGADWCSILQIHQADVVRADGSIPEASPPFAFGLRLNRAGRPELAVSGVTSTGVPEPGSFAPGVTYGHASIAFGRNYAFDVLFWDGHGGPGRVRLVLDGAVVCDSLGPTGHEYVDLLAHVRPVPQETGSYLKFGIYAGAFSGGTPPPGVSVAYTFRHLRDTPR